MHMCYRRICIPNFRVLISVNRDTSIVHVVIIKHGQELLSRPLLVLKPDPNHSSGYLYGFFISSFSSDCDCT